MGVAMHSYNNAYGRLPPPSWGMKIEKGRPTGNLSWRVALLPHFGEEENALYRAFHLDEPWDSEHNKKLIEKMPRVYMNPRAPAEPGKTYYKVFVGGGAVFDRDSLRAMSIAQIRDGTSNTIMIAEGGEPVIWTKPDDFEFDPRKPLNLAIPGATGINVCMADGSVRFIDPNRVSQQTLKAAITASGGEVLGRDW
jgi:prepilin-type processing-associated H-X9-DG protein